MFDGCLDFLLCELPILLYWVGYQALDVAENFSQLSFDFDFVSLCFLSKDI